VVVWRFEGYKRVLRAGIGTAPPLKTVTYRASIARAKPISFLIMGLVRGEHFGVHPLKLAAPTIQRLCALCSTWKRCAAQGAPALTRFKWLRRDDWGGDGKHLGLNPAHRTYIHLVCRAQRLLTQLDPEMGCSALAIRYWPRPCTSKHPAASTKTSLKAEAASAGSYLYCTQAHRSESKGKRGPLDLHHTIDDILPSPALSRPRPSRSHQCSSLVYCHLLSGPFTR
jgi:hypothetical protein